MGKNPTVSVITATFNRSNILKYSISSLIRSEFQDWEQIIVGDCCTDDSAEVVDSFNDNRIRWFNLDENWGEQSVPNNHGCSMAKGKYIAFLNHDDLWFPHHLSTCLEYIEKWQCDLVYGVGALVRQDGEVIVNSLSPTGRVEPDVFVPASLWLFKKEMMEDVGPWKSFRQTHSAPSYDWLMRAYKMKKDMRMVPSLSVVLVTSGRRKDSYKNRDETDNRRAYEAMIGDSNYGRDLCFEALRSQMKTDRMIGVGQYFKKFVRALFYRIALFLGFSPNSILNYIRYRRHGGWINYLRKNRGLKPK